MSTPNNPNPNPKSSEDQERPFLCHRLNRRSRVSEASELIMSRPIRFLKHFAGEIARVLCMVSGNRRRSSRKTPVAVRPKPFATGPPLDCQRVEAIEDCIQFINSSCTFSRSNSTTSFLPALQT